MTTAAAAMATPTGEEFPIRAEVFGIERLEQHAKSLAAEQRVTDRRRLRRDLRIRVRENGHVLQGAYRSIVEAVQEKREIGLAEEWLLDNFYVVDEQLREIRDHLPRSYYRQLPKIADGHLEGHPRVYGLAWAYVAHTDSRFELLTLQLFVAAYQSIQPLTIGELWAVAIHLRMALVENLRRVSEQVIRARHARAEADARADRLLGLAPGGRPETVEEVLGDLHDTVLSRAFTVQLVQRLRDQDASVTPALAWLNQKLEEQGTSSAEMVAAEHHAQGSANATVRNIITSMRWMSSIDWLEFFESVSLVDEALHAAPAYAAMDFVTRDAYRHEIELLSRGSGRSEVVVAREAVALAQEAARENAQQPPPAAEHWISGVPQNGQEDPGYYLVSKGRPEFERRLGFRFHLGLWLRRRARSHAIAGYLGGIVAFSAALLGWLLFLTASAGAARWTLFVLGSLGLVLASDIAVAVVHRVVAALLPPRSLPKLEFSQGVPAALRTLVAVPTLLANRADIAEQLERLEVHYLANPEGHLHFALLTDWADAAAEHMPGDEELLAAVAAGIASLNARYGDAPGGERFLLLHRRRLWNEKEGRWIGWERKRGKLCELNRLLRGVADTTFISIDGRPPHVPPDVRYVITLDADTRLPKDAAYQLVGAMAHPLNRPRFDPEEGRVVDGYAIMQPRITPSLPT